MDHIIIIIGEWRSDAICNDPRLWINHGSSVDQSGSTWIKRLQLPPAAHVSCVMCHVSCVMCHALSPFSVMTPDSWLMCPRSTRHAPRVMLHASCSTRHTPRVMLHVSTRHAPRVMLHVSTLAASIQPLHSAPGAMPGISHRLDPLGQCPINAFYFAPLR